MLSKLISLSMEFERLREQVENCKRCKLWKGRLNVVFGEGNSKARIMLIGMGPGYHENLQGRPFVGAAGKLLNQLLLSVGLRREEVYIANVIKCYLPDNSPTEEEIEACGPYLDRQIELIKPKVIVTLGNIATQYIFNKFKLPLANMHKLHGKVFSVSNLLIQAKVIPMYHPAAALRNPGLRSVVEDDWKAVGKVMLGKWWCNGEKLR